MANQEGVKIVITAEDRFTENIKKIEASTKLFGETAKNTERYLAALEKEMIRLVANGLDPASAKIQEMKANYDRLSQSINGNNNALKESNKKWTSLALVVQDLPYGFRGIQNNLPALFGSIASAAGPAYLAFSAIVAAITYFDQESSKATESTNKLYESFNKLKTETLSVGSIFSAVRQGTLSASDATKIYNDKLGDLYGTAKNVYEAEALYVRKTEGYIKAQYFRAKADIEYEKAKEALAKKDAAYGEDQIGVLGKIASAAAAFFKGGAMQGIAGLYKTSTILANDLANQQVELAGYVTDREEAEFQKRLALGERYNSQAYKIEQQYGIKSQTIKDKTAKKDGSLNDRIKAIKEANKAETDAYIQTLDERAQKEYKAGLDLANNLEKMRLAGYTDSTTYYTAYRAEMANIGKYYDNKQLEEQKKQNEKELKESISFAKNQADIIKTQSDVEQKLFNGNLRQQQDALKANMAKLAVLAANTFDPQVAQVYLDMFDKLNAKLTGLGENWDKTARQINSVIQNFIVSSFSLLGESLGKALAGENVDILNSFAILIADALINVGKSLIEYATMVGLAMTLFSNPLTWPAALAAGIAAVAAGAFLKSQLSKKNNGGDTPKFANGGIVSGPTLGLMGEYPGARSNPEVIAPLDKLKGLIGGGGGGTLTARISGNDLLILMNKASRTNSTTF